MALPVQQQAKYWGIAAAVFLVALYFIGDVIMPFILGGAIAYVLDPIADRLEKMGMSRILSVVVITVIAVLVFVLLILLVIPTLSQQAASLVKAAPGSVEWLQSALRERFPTFMEENSPIRQSLVQIGETIQEKGGALLNGLVGSVTGLVNVLVLIFLVPIIAFYLLLDWDRMVAQIDNLLPRDHVPVIRQIAKDIDRTLAAFIRGQGTVCLILGCYYAISLALVGLNFGFVVGAIAGLISFIPYVGALFGGALALGIALFQFWGEWWWIAAVALIFFSGQFVEGNILTPNLVGNSVGLHPVWLIFALSVFGTLFGFTGLLVAVPVTASLGVVARFLVTKYQAGRLYTGLAGQDDVQTAALEDETNDETGTG